MSTEYRLIVSSFVDCVLEILSRHSKTQQTGNQKWFLGAQKNDENTSHFKVPLSAAATANISKCFALQVRTVKFILCIQIFVPFHVCDELRAPFFYG